MPFNPEIHDRAYEFFIEEVPELLQAIEDGILLLRQDRSASTVHAVMRAAHSIKGGAASVELDAIKTIAHRLETVFRSLYNESVVIDADLEMALLQGYDCLQQPLTEQMGTGTHDPEQALLTAEPILAALEEIIGEEALSQADNFIPSSSELGVDMVASIFEVDVAQGLERLQEVAAHPEANLVIEELQTQAEVFSGFGELLELPGFSAIAQAVLEAVERQPQQQLQILALAIANFATARDEVLAGDRAQGGTPLPELLSLVQGGASIEEVKVGPDMSLSDMSLSDITLPEDFWTGIELADNSVESPSGVTLPEDFWAGVELADNSVELADNSVELADSSIDSPDELSNNLILGGEFDFLSEDLLPLETELSVDRDGEYYQSEPPVWLRNATLYNDLDPDPISDEPTILWLPQNDEAIAPDPSEPTAIAEPQEAFSLEALAATLIAEGVLMAPTAEVSGVDTSETDQRDTGYYEELSVEGLFLEDSIAKDSIAKDSIAKDSIAKDSIAEDLLLEDLIVPEDLISEKLLAEDLLAEDSLTGLAFLTQDVPSTQDPSHFFGLIETGDNAGADAWLNSENLPLDRDASPSVLGYEALASKTLEPETLGPETLGPETLGPETLGPETLGPETLEPDAVSELKAEVRSDLQAVADSQTEIVIDPLGLISTAEANWNLPLDLDLVLDLEAEVFNFDDLVIQSTSNPAPTSTTSEPPAAIAPLVPAPPSPLANTLQALETVFSQLPPVPAADLLDADTSPSVMQSRIQEQPTPSTSQVPKAKAKAKASPDPAATSSQTEAPAKRTAAPGSNLSVRVDMAVLERMNNLVGELVLNRNSLSLQQDQLDVVVRKTLKRFSQFQSLLSQLRVLSDRMLISGDRRNPHSQRLNPHRPNAQHHLGADFAIAPSALTPAASESPQSESFLEVFDILEMDRYNELHSQLQDIFEEVMQLEESVGDINFLVEQSNQTLTQQRQRLNLLQNELMWARMLPLDNILSRFPRVLRELSNKYNKPVELQLSGTHVLIDKGILEKLYDPLLHLLRNAFDHGIELPEIRCQTGKPEQGTIQLRAFYQGNQTIIEVQDDGRGVNTDRIAQKLQELGWFSAQEIAAIPVTQLQEFIFEPGFSTANKVSELSGRGVGLDVVRAQLKELKGSVMLNSVPGQGTTFTLKLPLTLTISKLLICQVSSLALGIPSDSIEDLLIPQSHQLKMVANKRCLLWGEQLIPLYSLAQLLQYNCPLPDATTMKNLIAASIPIPQDWALPVLILRQGQQAFALEVNRILMEQELVLKPFGSAIAPPPYTYGCTILGDGRMIPVIDSVALISQGLGFSSIPSTFQEIDSPVSPAAVETVSTSASSPSSLLASNSKIDKIDKIVNLDSSANGNADSNTQLLSSHNATPPLTQVPRRNYAKTILVVDDSSAMRRTLALSLEKAGYRVLQASDGQEALEQLRQGSGIQLVVCDVEMPNMNGFEFLSQRRREPELLQVPVVMLTSRSSDKHRRLATQLNANGYFSKPYVEQDFLKSLANILQTQAPTSPVST